MVSIVVPAPNEKAFIERCLRALPLDDAEVVVVCNGWADNKATVAAAVHRAVRVETVPEASKTAALNRGDAVAQSFPRVYLDADTVLSGGAAEAMAVLLTSGAALVTSPSVVCDVTRSSLLMRAYYWIWSQLPSVGGDIVGCGAYAVSERRAGGASGPSRTWLGDDHFVRDAFEPEERLVVDATSTVTAPRTVRDLVRRKVRVFTGNRLVYSAQPGGRTRGRRRQSEWVGVVRRDPRRVLDVPVYLAITVVAKGLSRWRQRRGTHLTWAATTARADGAS